MYSLQIQTSSLSFHNSLFNRQTNEIICGSQAPKEFCFIINFMKLVKTVVDVTFNIYSIFHALNYFYSNVQISQSAFRIKIKASDSHLS